MSDRPLAELLLDAVRRFFEPLFAAAEETVEVPAPDPADPPLQHPVGLLRMLDEAGLRDEVGSVVAAELPRLSADLATAETDLDQVTVPAGDDEVAALAVVVQGAVAVLPAMVALEDALDALHTRLGPETDEVLADVPAVIGRWLVWQRTSGLPGLWPELLHLVGAVEPPADGDGPVLDPDALLTAVTDPGQMLRDELGWGEPQLDGGRLLGHLLAFARGLGLPVTPVTVKTGDGPQVALDVDLVRPSDLTDPPVDTGARLRITAGAPDATDAVTVGFIGDASLDTTAPLGRRAALSVEAGAVADDLPELRLRPSGVEVVTPGAPGVDGRVVFRVDAGGDDDGPLTLLPLGRVGGVSAEHVQLELVVDSEGDGGVGAAIRDGRLTVAPENPDGFLAMLLPDDGIVADVDVAARWTTEHGLEFEGAAGLEVDVPLGIELLRVLRLDLLHVGVGLEVDGLALSLGLTAGASLGPLDVTVAGIGVTGRLARSSGTAGVSREGGALVVDLAAAAVELGFQPPSGIGLALDLGVVAGGGFLEVDDHRYAGALELRTAQLGLSAFGIVETRLPDGGDGFSMLAFVSGQFAPIQLGFGFTLLGVGGIVGIHRDVDTDALFAAVRAGTAGDLLRPDDPVADAPRLIGLAEGIFPARRGQYVFGPTVALGWGTPTLLSLDLALAVTVPDPLRIVLIGRLSGAVPAPEAPIVAINLDLAGVLDISGRRLEMEGRLYDSTVQLLPVEGGFALRTSWGADHDLVFSVGGLHPSFEPPPRFPDVAHMGVNLSKGRSLRLTLGGYFAITSNTLQLGAAADLRLSEGDYTLVGGLGFDALVEFDPFQLRVDVRARLAVMKGRRSLLEVLFRGTLSGPNPWHVRGRATIELPLLPDLSVGASVTFGSERSVPSEPVAVRQLLEAAIAEAASWRPAGPPAGLVLAPGGDGRLDPRGPVALRQEVAPLGQPWQQFYGKPVSGSTSVDVDELRVAGTEIPVVARTTAPFAPGAFRTMSERERLSAPAFEDLPAGVVADPSALRSEGTAVGKPAGREEIVLGPRPMDGGRDRAEMLATAVFADVTLASAAPAAPAVVVGDEQWVAADGHGTPTGDATTWSEASLQDGRPVLAVEVGSGS